MKTTNRSHRDVGGGESALFVWPSEWTILSGFLLFQLAVFSLWNFYGFFDWSCKQRLLSLSGKSDYDLLDEGWSEWKNSSGSGLVRNVREATDGDDILNPEAATTTTKIDPKTKFLGDMIAKKKEGNGDKKLDKEEEDKEEEKKKKKEQTKTVLSLEGVIPRAFEKWSFPQRDLCQPPDKQWWNPRVQRQGPVHDGFMFLREMKTGSSTMIGVSVRIARALARRHFKEEGRRLCRIHFDHSSAVKMGYGNRTIGKSFLFTLLREPTDRAVSQFFHFAVSRDKVEPSDANFRRFLKIPVFDQYYLRDLSPRPYVPYENDKIVAANHILNSYDFIGITERLSESLVALQMILGLKTSDLIYLSRSKGKGGFDDGGHERGCVYIIPSFVSGGMADYFRSEGWRHRVHGDDLLYHAANRSLDMTIERLGRDKFDENLRLFEHLQRKAQDRCLADARWPCSPDGVKLRQTFCLWSDSGCGVACLDKLGEEYDGG